MFDKSIKNLIGLIEKGESSKVEFKSMFPSNHVIASYLTAFANTDGGIMFFGIGDNGEILGLSDYRVESAINRLKRIHDSLSLLSIDIGNFEVDSKKIAYAIVEKAPQSMSPIMTSRGEIYIRQGHEVIRLSKSKSDKEISSHKYIKRVTIFIAMSFREEEEPSLVDYFKAMERALKLTNLPMDIIRVDIVEGDYEISQKIMSEIDKSEIVIADLTLNSANVYYELGYARAKKCYIIQTARKDTVLEFDIQNWRTLFYRNATELEEKLIPALFEAYEKLPNKE